MRTIFLTMLVAGSLAIQAQTNTFPATGNVGIGTANPNAKLDIVGGALWVSQSANQRLVITQNLNNDGTAILDNRAAIGDIKFQLSGTDRFTIKRNGNIGIGTTNPSAKFNVRRDDPLTINASNVVTSNISGVRLSNLTTSANAGTVINFQMGSSGTSHAAIAASRPSADNSVLHFYTENQSVQERMRITSNGNVGIGIKSPTNTLEIYDQTDFGDVNANMTRPFRIQQKNGGGFVVQPYNGLNYTDTNPLWIINSHYGEEIAIQSGASGTFVESKATFFKTNGMVGIGTKETGSHKLAVEGSIGAREIKVEASGWSDFVFEKDYDLRSLEEVETHIAEKGHLPDIPSEAEVMENGINLGEMNAQLLQKIEELTLYLIEQNKELNALKEKNKELETRLEKVEE